MAKDEDLYTEHAKNVYRYLFSLSGEADTAEELTQETFYRALKSLDSYRGEASPQVSVRYRKKAEEEMRAQIGIEHAPAPKLGFLRRYRTRQLVSALLAAVIAITLMCLLYSSDFKYQNTEAGRLSAVEDFVTQEKTGLSREDELVAVEIGTPLTVHAWAEYDGRLYLFFSSDNSERVQASSSLSAA